MVIALTETYDFDSSGQFEYDQTMQSRGKWKRKYKKNEQ